MVIYRKYRNKRKIINNHIKTAIRKDTAHQKIPTYISNKITNPLQIIEKTTFSKLSSNKATKSQIIRIRNELST
jgi:hypothetical protein